MTVPVWYPRVPSKAPRFHPWAVATPSLRMALVSLEHFSTQRYQQLTFCLSMVLCYEQSGEYHLIFRLNSHQKRLDVHGSSWIFHLFQALANPKKKTGRLGFTLRWSCQELSHKAAAVGDRQHTLRAGAGQDLEDRTENPKGFWEKGHMFIVFLVCF